MFLLTKDNIDSIKTKEEFVSFLQAMENDYKTDSDSWQNRSLDSYFDAIAAWQCNTIMILPKKYWTKDLKKTWS